MTEQSENKELLYKILLLGDSSVGKTCFLMRYTDNTYQEIHMSTIGIDNKFKDVELEDGKKVKIQIWDTAGQDRFRSITRNYYKGANGIVLIFDVTNKKSYENVKNWVKQIKEEVSSRVTIILVANKIDDVNHRIVTKEEGEKIANECGLMFFECSAKTGENIEHAFNELVKKTVENYSKVGQGGEKLKNVQLDDGKIVKIQIWDTAGQDRFRSITKNYYKGAHGILLIYDVTSRKTYDNIKNWVTQIKEEVSEKVTIILVGNKIDDEKKRKVSTEEGEKMAKECGLSFYETSAKSGINIDSTFNELVTKTVEKYSKVDGKGDKLNNKKSGSKKGCCL